MRFSRLVALASSHLTRFALLQIVAASGVAALWIAGYAGLPFQGDSAPACYVILGMLAVGLAAVAYRRYSDAEWIAIHVVRVGLLGTVVGLIVAFSAAGSGSADPAAIKPMIASVVSGMYVSLYATLLGISSNLWLKINLRLLSDG